jgi:tetratricopeptide (TPR) repeat protein
MPIWFAEIKEIERLYESLKGQFPDLEKELERLIKLELIERVIESSPDDYNCLDTKGWGLYKLGRYKESLELLEKAWDLKPIYNHEIYLHLEKVKKAIADQVST